MAKAFGIITSSVEHKVEGLQDYRPIGGFSFLGRYRVIDFPISNFSNSGIINLQVYISNKPRSLAAHIGTGRHYNINSKRGSIQLLFPTEEKLNPIYNTNIQAIWENMENVSRMPQEYVVIAPSCMVFKQDFDEFLQGHVASGADISVLYHKVHHAKSGYNTCHTLSIVDGMVEGISLNLGDEDERNISMETYVVKKDLLVKLVNEAREISSMYNLVDIFRAKSSELKVRAVEHTGFFAPITSLKSFYDANMELLDPAKAGDLVTPDWPIYTRTNDSCPTQFYDEAEIKNALVANGCEIHGTVLDSVIGRGVEIAEGAVVKGCYVSAYTKIGPNVKLENQVVDKYAEITHENVITASKDCPGYIKYRDKL